MKKEKAQLALVEAQNNLKFAEIKKNKIPKSSSSLSDNNSNDREDILENDIVSTKYNPVQSLYQYYQISVDNKKSNKSFRDKSKSENHENKTPNSATVIEPNDKFQDELFEGQDVS